ncbi:MULTISPECIES: hypothetical protein [Aerococcus]|uniref:hypothetical protein n=1 Tax=Aerococcus TaxID=1375 RepID=UPI000200EEFF|nr:MULTISPECIES: hypothetical protein [Aerococcus]AEA00541.1 hypothetical protein HMPREF9243_0366 [Aerococcus sp. Group 1]MCY3030702.1 hypothetical protein [Aerococcus sp. Group 1]MCY3054333.1 hypothetical protein [Aerococcus sp. Group 1]MCY3056063.1 hypothetical protein [Aerococcus sp. Group 1]MCY3062033.1 hypothetical protein [Aerococcus sp. Group 1]
MNKAVNETLTVLGGVFLLILLLNLFLPIDFFNYGATITYFVFALVYFGVRTYMKK